MRKIALIAFTFLPLFADFFPSTIHTSISKVDENNIILSSDLPVDGMSGIVIHNYGKDIEAITARFVQLSHGHIKLIPNDIIHHKELPTIKTTPKVGDRVIGGYLYDNILLLAPNADTYAKITSTYKKNWIHPDLYALFLSKEDDSYPTRENLKKFANEYQVGLIYIIRHNSAILLDPISWRVVGKKEMNNLPKDGKFPFYMRFDKIETGLFGGDSRGDYYKSIEKLYP